MTVHQALKAVQTELGAVGKDSTANAGGTYKYRGIDAVINALHPLLANHGVTIAPHVVAHSLEPFTGYSKPHTITIITVDYHIHGPDGDQLDPPVRSIGYGIDNTDKGPGKALSYAYKSAISQLFSLPTDDPSMDVEQTPEPQFLMTDLMVSEVLDLCEQMDEESCEKLTRWVVDKLGVTFDRRGLGRLDFEVGKRVVAQARKAAHDFRAEVQKLVDGLTPEKLDDLYDWCDEQGIDMLSEESSDSELMKLRSWLLAETGAEPFEVTDDE